MDSLACSTSASSRLNSQRHSGLRSRVVRQAISDRPSRLGQGQFNSDPPGRGSPYSAGAAPLQRSAQPSARGAARAAPPRNPPAPFISPAPARYNADALPVEPSPDDPTAPGPVGPAAPGNRPGAIQQQQQVGEARGGKSSIMITQRIKLCSSWRELVGVVSHYAPHFNALNAAAAITHLAQLGPGPAAPAPGAPSPAQLDAYAAYEANLQQVVQLAGQHSEAFTARQVANVMWAAARLSRQYGSRGHPLCTALLEHLMPAASALAPWQSGQELTNVLWAVAASGLSPDDDWLEGWLLAFETALPTAAPRHLAISLWALAQLGVAPDHEWVGAVAARGADTLPDFSARDAAQVLAGCAAMGHNLRAAAPQLLRGLRARLLQAAEAEWAAEEAADAKGKAAARLHDEFGGPSVSQGEGAAHALSSGLWALASLACVPSTMWMERALTAVETHLDDFTPQALATCTWAAVSLGQPLPPRLMRALYAATANASILATWPPQSLASLVWAVSVAASSASSSSSPSSTSGSGAGRDVAPPVAHPLAPPAPWASAFFTAVEAQLPSWGEQQVSMALVGLARLRLTPPPGWAAAVVSHLCCGTRAVGPQALANSLWALAKLGLGLNEEGLAAVSAALAARLRTGAAEVAATSVPTGAYQGAGAPPGAAAGLVVSAPTLASTSAGEPGAGAGGLQPQPAGALTGQELANVWYALARFRHTPAPELADALLGAARVQYTALLSSSSSSSSGAGSAKAAVPQAQAGSESFDGEQTSVPLRQQQAAAAMGAPGSVRAQELANTLWALAQLGVQPSDAWLASYWGAAMRLLPSFNAKDLSQTVYALAKLGRVPPGPGGLRAATPEQGAGAAHWPWPNLAAPGTYSVATARAGAHAGAAAHVQPSTSNSGAAAVGSQVQAGGAGSQGWAARLLSEAASTLARGNGQDMANLLWGLAQLGVRPGQAWCSRAAAALASRADTFGPGHVATCVWALGRCGFTPAPGQLLSVEAALFRRLGELAPRELAALMSGFATMEYAPDVELTQAYVAAAVDAAPRFRQQEWAVVLSGLAAVVGPRAAQGELVLELLASPALEVSLRAFGPAGVCMAAHAAGLLATGAAASAARRLLARSLEASVPLLAAATSSELGALVVAAARAGSAPPPRFLAAWMGEMAGRLGAAPASAQDTAEAAEGSAAATNGSMAAAGDALLAAADRGTKPASSVRLSSAGESSERGDKTGTSALQQRSTARGGGGGGGGASAAAADPLPPATLAIVGWSLARMGLRPKDSWRGAYLSALARDVSSLSAQETVMACVALATWGAPVPRGVVEALGEAVDAHRPMYDKASRNTTKEVMKVLRHLAV